MSPDVFLTAHQVPYDGYGGISATPAEIVKALQTLNKTRTWDAERLCFKYNRYSTPGFQSVPPNPNTWAPEWVAAEQDAIQLYLDALKTGVPANVYSAVDEINRVREVKGGPSWPCALDFDILKNGRGLVAEMAKVIATKRMPDKDSGEIKRHWFDSKDAFDALNAYVLPEASKSPIPPNAIQIPASSPDEDGKGLGSEIVLEGATWVKQSNPFPTGPRFLWVKKQ